MSDSMGRVIAIDPGGTTGYCLAYLDGHYLMLSPNQAALSHGQLYDKLVDWDPKNVICEEFEYRPGIAKPWLSLISKELIGVIKFYCEGRSALYMQRAAQGIGGFYKESSRLIEAEVYKKGCPHGMDATRHFLHWFKFGAGAKFRFMEAKIEPRLVSEEYIKDLYTTYRY